MGIFGWYPNANAFYPQKAQKVVFLWLTVKGGKERDNLL